MRNPLKKIFSEEKKEAEKPPPAKQKDTPQEVFKDRLAVIPYTIVYGLHTHLAYLQELVLWRLEHHFGKREHEGEMPAVPVLEEADQSPFAHFIRQRQPTDDE